METTLMLIQETEEDFLDLHPTRHSWLPRGVGDPEMVESMLHAFYRRVLETIPVWEGRSSGSGHRNMVGIPVSRNDPRYLLH